MQEKYIQYIGCGNRKMDSLSASIKHLTDLMQKFKEQHPNSEMTDPFTCKVHTDFICYLHLTFEHITVAWVENRQMYLVCSKGVMVALLDMNSTIDLLKGFEHVFNFEINPINETFESNLSLEKANKKIENFNKELCRIHEL